MSMLRFITCGSVDDGKSTLIGHMLYDAKMIFADQKKAVELDSKIETNGEVDYSLLLDGLEDERNQGITIDVAYRFFKSKRRNFIVADCPGHEEYTRNMAVGASGAQLAVILVDAKKGVQVQTKRHIFICKMMGIRDYLFAVNKMDLVDYDENCFRRIEQDLNALLQESENETFKIHSSYFLPVSATLGDNVTEHSDNMKWFLGKPLLKYLEDVLVAESGAGTDFFMPVQRVCRPNSFFRGYQGEIFAGVISEGDTIEVLPNNTKAIVNELIVAGKKKDSAKKGEPVTIVLDRELDISRGNVLTRGQSLNVNRSFVADVLVLDSIPFVVGKHYRLQIGTQSGDAVVRKIMCRLDINTGKSEGCDYLTNNQIGVCQIEAAVPFVFEPFNMSRELGSLLLVDYITHNTVAFGTIAYSYQEEGRAVKQSCTINRQIREERYDQKAKTLFFTGLSGAGKSTISDNVEKRLFDKGIHTMLLDGDNIRLGLCKDLGFSASDRRENIRRIAEVCRLMNDAGITVLASFVSPIESDRKMAREIVGEAFVEIYVNATLQTCISRDKKGLYKKALRGEIREFTGVSSPYEAPKNPEIMVDTSNNGIEECVQQIMEYMEGLL